eukprot:gene15933-18891_t
MTDNGVQLHRDAFNIALNAPNAQQARRHVLHRILHFHNCCNEAVNLILGTKALNSSLLAELRKQDSVIPRTHGMQAYRGHNPPFNKDLRLYARVKDHLDLVTHSHSERDVRIIVSTAENIHGKKGLHRHFNLQEENDIPLSTYRDILVSCFAAEHTERLQNASESHNVCVSCKALFLERDSALIGLNGANAMIKRIRRLECEAACLPIPTNADVSRAVNSEEAELLAEVVERQAEYTAIKAKISAHFQDDKSQRKIMHFLLGVELDRLQLAHTRNLHLAKRLLRIFHVDGETSRQLPKLPLTSTQEQMGGWRVSNMGIYDMLTNTMHNVLMDHGVGKEDANVLVTVLLQVIICKTESNDEIFVFVMDCCAVGNCGLVDWFLTFVVDELQLVRACGVVYFWTNHGKGPADTRYGQHQSIHKHSLCLSIDMYGVLLERVQNKKTKECDTTTILHASGIPNWAEYAQRRTQGLVPYPGYFKFKEADRHEAWVVRSIDNLPQPLAQYLSEFEAPTGWVVQRHKLRSTTRKFCFLPRTQDQGNARPKARLNASVWDLDQDPTASAAADAEEKTQAQRLNRHQVVKNGYNFFNRRHHGPDQILDIRTVEEAGIVLYPSGYTGMTGPSPDMRAYALDKIDRRPNTKTGIFPSLVWLNCELGRGACQQEGVEFVDPQEAIGGPRLPMACPKSSKFYNALCAFGATTVPHQRITLADVVEWLPRPDGTFFTFDAPHACATDADMRTMHSLYPNYRIRREPIPDLIHGASVAGQLILDRLSSYHG